jgi:predicted RNA-binding Zn-ribbon protein involved in translation (DUF1610 family)
MKQDLLAPPKMSARTYAKVTGGICIAIVSGGVIYSFFNDRTLPSVGLSAVLVLLLAAGSIWTYAALLRRAQQFRPERLPLIHALFSSLGLLTIMGAACLMFPSVAHIAPWWQLPCMFGLTLAAGAWGRRFGDSMHCPACEYEFNFDDDDAPIRCPECGTPWLGRLKRGRRIRSPRLIAIGVSLAFFGAIILNPIFYMPIIGPSLPTPLLYASLYVSPGNMYQGWDALGQRPLSPRWTSIMADRVLSYRNRVSWDHSPAGWLEARIAANEVSSELTERYYTESFAAKLAIPTHARANEPFTASLRVTRAAEGKGVLAIMFEGYHIDDGPAIGRLNSSAWPHNLDPGVLASSRNAFETTLHADHPGEAHVRAVCWIVHQSSYSDHLGWQDDGTPVRPPTASWFERRELTATLRVDP